jgi:hypothetical protein
VKRRLAGPAAFAGGGGRSALRHRVERLFEDLQGERRFLEILRSMLRGRAGRGQRRRYPLAPPIRPPLPPFPIPPRRNPRPPHSPFARTARRTRQPSRSPRSMATFAQTRFRPFTLPPRSPGETRIFGIRNLQYKECDRIRRPIENCAAFMPRARFPRSDTARPTPKTSPARSSGVRTRTRARW